MADKTMIEWCDRTFNPWMGCAKVSDGCKFCYAETLMDTRYKKVKWGPRGTRVRTSAENWRKPLRWNREAWLECQSCGWRGEGNEFHACPYPVSELKPTRQRVFCASLADVLEDRPELFAWRNDLFELIEQTSDNLDWLILTKRPENARDLLPAAWFEAWPGNVWMGTTVENQKAAEERIPYLLDIPARVRFLSVEPMLGKIDLGMGGIHWVICGGESGQGCRPMEPAWAGDLRFQCGAAGAPFFMKQLGGHPDKRDKIEDFPAVLRVREWPV